jgi:ComEC/Rec2-related protein
LSGIVAPLRCRLKQQLVAHLEGEEAALLAGLLLGEREQLSPDTVNAFKRTGTLHLLAVSGSNVGVVICVTWGVLLFLRIPRPVRILLAGFLVVLFCFLAHSEASVMRASLAGLLALGALALRRRADPLNLWGCALLLLLAWEPAWLLDVGFQLSFGATLGILLAAPLIPSGGKGSRLQRLVGALLGSLVVSMSAQLGTLPTLAAAFNEVPLVTPLSNLVCVPLAGVATSAGVLSLLLSPLGDAVLAVTSAATWLGLRLLLLAVHAFDGLHVPAVGLPTPGVLDVLCFAGSSLTLLAYARCPAFRRRAIFCEGVLLCLWLGLRYGSAPAGPEAVVLDGPDLAVVTRLPSGEVWTVTGNPDFPTARAVQVALKLGWSVPSHRIDLKSESDRSSLTPRTAGCCDSVSLAEPPRAASPLAVWCRRLDSRPVAVVVADSRAALVICRDDFAHRPPELAPFRRVLWVSDSPALRAREAPDLGLLAGRAPVPPSADTAQTLSTRSSGTIRILWSDGVFQTEPSIR